MNKTVLKVLNVLWAPSIFLTEVYIKFVHHWEWEPIQLTMQVISIQSDIGGPLKSNNLANIAAK